MCRYFDFEKLAEVTRLATRNLNKIIDVNHYPVETAERSNKKHRPIGLGVQVCPQSIKQPASDCSLDLWVRRSCPQGCQTKSL